MRGGGFLGSQTGRSWPHVSSCRNTGMVLNPTRTSRHPSSVCSTFSSGSGLSFFLTALRIQTAFLSLAPHLPASFHCRKPLASEVPAKSISSWFPRDHFEEGFPGELIRAFAHRSGSSFDEKSATIFSSSAFARSLQGA